MVTMLPTPIHPSERSHNACFIDLSLLFPEWHSMAQQYEHDFLNHLKNHFFQEWCSPRSLTILASGFVEHATWHHEIRLFVATRCSVPANSPFRTTRELKGHLHAYLDECWSWDYTTIEDTNVLFNVHH